MAAVAALSSCSKVDSQPAEIPQKDMCIQLYSIREVIGDSALYADNHETVLAQLAEMGYTDIEAANYGKGRFYGVSPEQFKADLEAAGLNPLSSHATYVLTADELKNHDFTAAMAWWDEAIAAHKAAGMSYIVTPWNAQPKSMDEARTLVDYHNAVGEKVNAAGMKYGYHTHSQEYEKIADTDTVWIEYLVENTKPENMFWQLDTYLASKAGIPTVEYLKKYPGRFTMLHLKDRYELDQSGMVNLRPIFAAADAAGLKDFVVEQEGTDGSHSVMDAAAMNADYLRSADFVKPSYK